MHAVTRFIIKTGTAKLNGDRLWKERISFSLEFEQWPTETSSSTVLPWKNTNENPLHTLLSITITIMFPTEEKLQNINSSVLWRFVEKAWVEQLHAMRWSGEVKQRETAVQKFPYKTHSDPQGLTKSSL